jgi:hypothetical protein
MRCVRRIALLGAAALVAGSLATPVHPQTHAADTAYLSVTGGTSIYLAECGNPYATNPCDRAAPAWRVAAGLHLGPMAAVELTVIDFGQARGLRLDEAEDVRVQMVGLGSVLPLDFGAGLSGKVRLGLAGVRTTRQRARSAYTAASTWRIDSPQYYGGVSFAYALSRHFSLEVAWDFTQADLGVADPRVHALTAGAALRF